MQVHARLLLLNVILAALLSGWCGNSETQPPNGPSPTPTPVAATAPKRLSPGTGEEVTFYPTFAYKDASGWVLSLRGWVHEDSTLGNKLRDEFKECGDENRATFQARTVDLLDESKNQERVIIKFDSDPENKPYENVKRSKADGIVTIDLTLADERAKLLLEKQGSANGWLTYRAISADHTGLGRVRLIEPGAGESMVSDIDDTIKITAVPGEKKVVLRNTFCLAFQAVLEPDMARMYRDRNIPVHYVSGGPEQLFGPLYDYLIAGAGGFPEGTFHLKFFPTPLTPQGLRTLIDTAQSSMSVTHAHKVEKIKWLMEKFPERQFTLIGDSGEVDPEVYNEIKKWRPAQIKEIVIRDVINDEVVNPFRLAGMTIIKVAQPVCVDAKHFGHLEDQMKKAYAKETYKLNTAPPCAPVK